MGRAGVVWGLWAGEQAGTARGWSVWTGGSGILCVCCFSFLTKRLVLASVCLIPWDLVEDIGWDWRGPWRSNFSKPAAWDAAGEPDVSGTHG